MALGGVPEEVLMDSPRALVVRHDPARRTVTFNDKLIAFARHWGFTPRACAPFRAHTHPSAIARQLQKRSCRQHPVSPTLRFGQPRRWLNNTAGF